jgi:hypothetical protein
MAPEKQKQGATAVGSGDLLGVILFSLANLPDKIEKCKRIIEAMLLQVSLWCVPVKIARVRESTMNITV